jgi:hypothetical protein
MCVFGIPVCMQGGVGDSSPEAEGSSNLPLMLQPRNWLPPCTTVGARHDGWPPEICSCRSVAG